MKKKLKDKIIEIQKNEWYKPIKLIIQISLGTLLGVFIILGIPSQLGGEAWIGFWGGIAGAIISSTATIVVLKKTIEFDREKEINDKRLRALREIRIFNFKMLDIQKHILIKAKVLDGYNREMSANDFKELNQISHELFKSNMNNYIYLPENILKLCGDIDETVKKCEDEYLIGTSESNAVYTLIGLDSNLRVLNEKLLELSSEIYEVEKVIVGIEDLR